ncbi:MAG: CYTH domain-containing protein [Catonella sp.]|uniref:CYTH domain-containing protein n=1 Tax=Catonella sp. TaxID=2382125 RepID=UPI003FA01EC2
MKTEKEIKIMLSKEQYDEINDYFEWDDEFVQTNYYYSEDIEIETNEEVTFRVRVKNKKKILQIKIPEEKNKSLHIKKEYEKELNTVPQMFLGKSLNEIVGVDRFSDVFLIGDLTTNRKLKKQSDGIEICLDRNKYLGLEDYELEIEFKEEYPTGIVKILENKGITTAKETSGKYSRFNTARKSSCL